MGSGEVPRVLPSATAQVGGARVLGCADAVQRRPSHGAVQDLVSGKQKRRVPVPGMERRDSDGGREGRMGAWAVGWVLFVASLGRAGGLGARYGWSRLRSLAAAGFVVGGGAPSRICTPGQERQGMVVRVADWLLGALTPSTERIRPCSG